MNVFPLNFVFLHEAAAVPLAQFFELLTNHPIPFAFFGWHFCIHHSKS